MDRAMATTMRSVAFVFFCFVMMVVWWIGHSLLAALLLSSQSGAPSDSRPFLLSGEMLISLSIACAIVFGYVRMFRPVVNDGFAKSIVVLAAALNVVYLLLQAILNNRLTDAVAAAAIILAILAPFFLFLLVGVIANEAKTPYRSRIVALSFAFVLWLVVPPFL